jgi:alpha-beta hydrolase superfamily lysophospholipase
VNPLGIVVILFICYAVLLAGIYFLQQFFFFRPEKLPPDYRFLYPDLFEEITITGPEGNKIDVLLFKHRNPKGVVLYFKGNTKSIKGWSKFRADFVDAGYDFVIFDYPGYGKSTGHHNQKEIFADTQEVYSYVKNRYGEDKIVIYGRSMGSGFAAFVAHQNNPRLLILDSPYTSTESLFRYYTRIVPVHFLLRLQVPVDVYLAGTRCPVHLIHGTDDKIIPFRFSRELEQIDPSRITLHAIPGGKHNNLPRIEEFHTIVKEILNGNIK